jgi:hypothetical protein
MVKDGGGGGVVEVVVVVVVATTVIVIAVLEEAVGVVSNPRNRPWRPIGLWDVKDPTLSRQSAHS